MNDLLLYLRQQLSGSFAENELHDICWWLAEELTGKSRTQILLDKDTAFSPNEQTEHYISRLKQGEPLPYILGYTDWRGLRLHLNRSTLIPRPETAELVDLVLEKERGKENLHLIDLCTGSGCIAIAIKKARANWDITATDISAEALAIAQQNAMMHQANICFLQSDVLTADTMQCDVIVSNPPYIMESERPAMSHSVLDYEPQQALFAGDDPLKFYKTILTHHRAKRYYFEINPLLSDELISFTKAQHKHCTTHNDYCGKTRFMIVE